MRNAKIGFQQILQANGIIEPLRDMSKWMAQKLRRAVGALGDHLI